MRKTHTPRGAHVVPVGLAALALVVSGCSGPGAGVHTATGNGVLAPTTLEVSSPTTGDRACCGVFTWPEDLRNAQRATVPRPVVEHPIGTIGAQDRSTATTNPRPAPSTVSEGVSPPAAVEAVARRRAARLVIGDDDLGPPWVVQVDDDAPAEPVGNGSATGAGEAGGLFGGAEGSGPEQVAWERFLACARPPDELTLPPLASTEGPTFTAGPLKVTSAAEVYADPAVVAGQLEILDSDRGSTCLADAFGALVRNQLEPEGITVTSSDIRRLDHELLHGRGFLYDWVLVLQDAKRTWQVETFVIALADRDAMATVTLFGADDEDQGLVDDLVHLLARKAEVI